METLVKAWIVGIGLMVTAAVVVAMVAAVVTLFRFLCEIGIASSLAIFVVLPCAIGFVVNGLSGLFGKKGRKK